ncbi:MAG TPA: right-handed parallel beta-helix repeat-containing protein [Verrucomicrobiae bacterium]|nr:right-handed parallel beta-helix repeat-containing protein [Verrucomicrobiae bacterium]
MSNFRRQDAATRLGGFLPAFLFFVFSASLHAAEFYNDWATNHLSSVPSQSGPTNDPDGDGVVNLAEYTFGTDPMVSDGGTSIIALPPETNGIYKVEILERAGHRYGVQIDLDAAADLSHWIRPWWIRTVTNSLPEDPANSVRELFITYLPDTNIFFVRASLHLFDPGPGVANYYVATNGSDSATGTSTNTPFRSVAKAVSVASPGNLIYVRGGTYSTNATITISTSGAAANPIRLRAYPGEHPILNFSSQTLNSSNRGINFNANWWQVYGLEIASAGDNGIALSGSSNIIECCVLHHNRDTGLQISGSGSRVPASNLVLNCDSYMNRDATGENADGFAAKSFPESGTRVGPNIVFRGCRSWDNADDGWDLWQTTNAVVIDTCWTWGNGTNLATAGDGNGFKLGGHNSATTSNFPGPHVVTHCVSFKNFHNGFDQNNNAAGITLCQNTAWANGDSNFQMNHVTGNSPPTIHAVTNNVSIDPGANDAFYPGSILVSNSWQVLTSPVGNTNDFLDTARSWALAPRRDDGSLPETPLLRPVPGGRLVDQGANTGAPFNGIAPDIGAFETPVW